MHPGGMAGRRPLFRRLAGRVPAFFPGPQFIQIACCDHAGRQGNHRGAEQRGKHAHAAADVRHGAPLSKFLQKSFA